MEVILLTNTDSIVWQRSIGAYQIANTCRLNGISCQVIDFTEMFSEHELLSTVEKFISKDTLVLGISTTFYNTENKNKLIFTDGTKIRNNNPISENVKYVINEIKKKYSSVKIVGGGANSYLIKDNPLFDAVFHGYSEISFVDYLLQINKKKLSKFNLYKTINGVLNIDDTSKKINIETLEHYWTINDCVLDGETLPIEISRGCIFKCKFCSYPLNGKNKFDYIRNPECIKQEMLNNYAQYGTVNYFFADDTLNDSTHKIKILHDMLISLPFKIKFVAYLRIDLLFKHREQIKLLKNMGLGSAFFGIETLNNTTGKIIGKGLSSDKIKIFLDELHDTHWEKQIPITTSFIVGLPKEDKNSIITTAKWLKEKKFQDVWFPLRIQQLTYYKSDIDLNYEKYGYKLVDDGKWTNDLMSYDEANALAEEFNNDGFYSVKSPSSWFLFALLSHGYCIHDLMNIPCKKLPWKQILRQKKQFFEKYKKKLLSI